MIQNLERELKTLWQKSRPTMSEDEVQIFFDELFDPASTAYVTEDERIVAAGQWQEHKMTFVSQPISVGLISGLVVDPELKASDRAKHMESVLSELHRRQYAKGIMFSIVIPTDSKQRQWLEKQGYMTASHILSAETKVPEAFVPDGKVEVAEAMEWGREHWIFYVQHGGFHEFELRLSEADFFALLARHDSQGGSILVARRHAKICGIALVQHEGKPLKNGKNSEKQFRTNIKFVLATDAHVLYTMQQQALNLWPDAKQLVMTGGCPAKGFKGAQPHAMMRAICAEKFMNYVADRLPGLQLSVGISDDRDIPANNRGYRLRDGRCFVSDELGDSIVPPGGLPAMLLSGQPVQVPLV